MQQWDLREQNKKAMPSLMLSQIKSVPQPCHQE